MSEKCDWADCDSQCYEDYIVQSVGVGVSYWTVYVVNRNELNLLHYTQMERRLGAPLHGMMNAYCKCFEKYQRTSLVPRWKTLVLEDSNGAWLGNSELVNNQQVPPQLTNWWQP